MSVIQSEPFYLILMLLIFYLNISTEQVSRMNFDFKMFSLSSMDFGHLLSVGRGIPTMRNHRQIKLIQINRSHIFEVSSIFTPPYTHRTKCLMCLIDSQSVWLTRIRTSIREKCSHGQYRDCYQSIMSTDRWQYKVKCGLRKPTYW